MAATSIDPRAVVHPDAKLGDGVFVGPFCVIGAEAAIGDRCRLEAHVVLDGRTTLGPDNVVSPMVSIGGPPQDLKYEGEPTTLVVGARNRIREFATLNRGTAAGGGQTTIGDDNLIMAYAHVAHDCTVGSRTILANAATLAGHVEVGDDATIGAFSGVHQFARVARHAFIGGYSVVTQDALPFALTVGNRAESHGINVIGLRRRGFSEESISALRRAYKRLFRSKMPLAEALDSVTADMGSIAEVTMFVSFIRSSERGVIR